MFRGVAGAAKIGLEAGKIINKYKTGEHYGVAITDSGLTITSRQNQIEQGHPGDARGDQRRHPRRAPWRSQRAARPAAPLHQYAVPLPVLGARAEPFVPADRHRPGQVAIEEDHQLSKQSTGLDAGQVIR